jgi:hypothetical protein
LNLNVDLFSVRKLCSDLNAGHHSLQAAEVNMSAIVKGVEDLIGVLLNLKLWDRQ